MGSHCEATSSAPVAATCSPRPSGTGPNTQVRRPGWAMEMGPWRYSIAGYASVHDWEASRSFRPASLASPMVQPVPRKAIWSASTQRWGSSASNASSASAAAVAMSWPSEARK